MTGPSQQQASDPTTLNGEFVVVNLDRNNGEASDLNGEGSDLKKNPKYGSPEDDVELGPRPEPKHVSNVSKDDAAEGETVCRVCHLGLTSGNSESIVLGCACKQDLAMCHRDCAEEWFKIRGNTVCEICGETAKNVHILDAHRVETSAARASASNGGAAASSAAMRVDGGGASTTQARVTIMSRIRYLWANQLVRNSLLATMIIVFMVPWFFRIAYF